MKTNKYKLLRNYLLLTTPVAVFAASVSCSNSATKTEDPKKDTPKPETPPKDKQDPQTPPKTEDPNKTETPPKPETPAKQDENKPTTPSKPDKKPSEGSNTEGSKTETVESKQLKEEISKLSLYKDDFTKESYDQYFANLEKREEEFTNKKYGSGDQFHSEIPANEGYTKDQFKKDVSTLKTYYSQVQELLNLLKSKPEEVSKFLETKKSDSTSIFKVSDDKVSIDVLKINTLYNKLIAENLKKVQEKKNNSIPDFVTIGFGFGGKRSEVKDLFKQRTGEFVHLFPGIGGFPEEIKQINTNQTAKNK
ncbi:MULTISPECIES: hypothetical protein [unclassified Mycoplasma]|uniref:hypothetical protein n=1 Tax=unclassified Mycoplasma TaxID=2683645 RepID=UPI00211BD4DF|nr:MULTISPECIES: hypothetical protein [unclassified Mycoplasma]UUM20105.1 hypothetical protein NPA11_01620 [Mycoplasma sp. 1578d]UUM25085.1 hypothetical protein NPA12_01595 [Mycoplasma sp. 3686d]